MGMQTNLEYVKPVILDEKKAINYEAGWTGKTCGSLYIYDVHYEVFHW